MNVSVWIGLFGCYLPSTSGLLLCLATIRLALVGYFYDVQLTASVSSSAIHTIERLTVDCSRFKDRAVIFWPRLERQRADLCHLRRRRAVCLVSLFASPMSSEERWTRSLGRNRSASLLSTTLIPTPEVATVFHGLQSKHKLTSYQNYAFWSTGDYKIIRQHWQNLSDMSCCLIISSIIRPTKFNNEWTSNWTKHECKSAVSYCSTNAAE
jgi:hypothetical protein